MRLVVFEQQATCAPCRALKPHVTAAAQELDLEIEFKEVSENLDDVKLYGVRSTPTVFLFDDDKRNEIKSRSFLTLKKELEEVIGSNM